jgi:phytoene dehydrogenase-like protein
MHEVVIVGSGINSLVAAALFATKGRKVALVERNAWLGGTIVTRELGVPGHFHDLMSCWYPLFVGGPAFAALGPALAAQGLEFCHAEVPSAVSMDDGRALLMMKDRAANIALFEAAHPGDGAAHGAAMAGLERDLDLTFALLGGNLWSPAMAGRLAKEGWRRGPAGLSAFAGDALISCRRWLEATYGSDLVHALLAPWVLHTGLGPEATLSGHMGKVIAFTLEAIGMPVVKGGSSRLVEAFAALITAHGGTILTETSAIGIKVERGRAVAVETDRHGLLPASRAVVCNVPPHRLYGEMLPADAVPAPVRARAADYRFGRAGMQIHLALASPARWHDAALDRAATVHVTGGLDAVSAAVAEAERGLLPAAATIVVGQPAVVDPSRVPAGAGQLWIQLQELPRTLKGDAARLIATPADGVWTPAVAEAYADRIIARLERHIPGLAATILHRTVLSPTDLEGLNSNLVGGDPYCGDCGIDQFGPWRPFPGTRGHRTGITGLWHIGASTHPGPGLGGGSGFLAATDIG